MTRKTIANALLVIASFLASLLLLEMAARLGGEENEDGQFSFLGHDLHPYVLPVTQISARIEEFLAVQEWATVVYDPFLGWAYRPNSLRQGGIFTVNSAGIRSRREYARVPPDDTLRIALFGDSFTAGEDVGDEETWGRQLEIRLNEAGLRAEVLNFGVGGYGMDQAFLRWERLGKGFAPDLLVFGLQPENLKRNVNVFRQALNPRPGALPFSKPRFILQNDELALVNSPALPPEQLIDIYASFGSQTLAAYELHYQSHEYVSPWWAPSRLAGFLHALLTPDEESPRFYEADTEAGRLGKAIIEAFAADAKAQNASFAVAHLPLRSHLERYYSNFPPPAPPYQFLLEHSRQAYPYIAAEEHIDRAYLDEAYWTATGHYGPALHRLIAELVADEIIACIEDGSCALPRFDEGAGSFAVNEEAG